MGALDIAQEEEIDWMLWAKYQVEMLAVIVVL